MGSEPGGANLPETDKLGAVTRVVNRSAAAQIADQIVEAIKDERLRAGDRLPPERDQAERFGVSRPTIREALAALELAGMVQSHQGRGTVVVASASRAATWGLAVLPPQVFEARLAIEPQLAALAAEKRFPEDIAHLRDVLADLEDEYARTGAYESDLPVHLAIARAARNPILHHALESALAHTETELWTDLRRRALVAQQTREGHIKESQQVVRYIEAGRSKEAADVWRRHLVYYRDEMLRHGKAANKAGS
jgi:DNA-binding FadR family transcriptional regulator